MESRNPTLAGMSYIEAQNSFSFLPIQWVQNCIPVILYSQVVLKLYLFSDVHMSKTASGKELKKLPTATTKDKNNP